MEQVKNRDREAPSFANINLLGPCNADCFFCIGRELEEELAGQNQLFSHWEAWPNFPEFLRLCRDMSVGKIYITGQNTDSLLYAYLDSLIDFLHTKGFGVGLRTNGYLATARMGVINKCDLSIGYSIHTLDPHTNTFIMGRGGPLPSWDEIIPATNRPRISIVVNLYNLGEFFDIVQYISRFPNVRYIQARRVSSERRLEELLPDIMAFEFLRERVARLYPLKTQLWGDADVYDIEGMDVCFWRTTLTTINSLNYFTDGTISDEYYIVEGYLKNQGSR